MPFARVVPAHSLVLCFGSLVILGCLTGCGSDGEPDYQSLDLVPVSGTVTLDGEPLKGAVVFFESPDQTRSFSETDETGGYRLMFNSEKPGVPQGTKVVRISTVTPLGEDEEVEEDGVEARFRKRETKPVDRIPSVYNCDSKISVEVTSATPVFDFVLTSDGSLPAHSMSP